MTKTSISIGCSSFYNRKWVGIFYPEVLPPKDWFNYYSEQFNTYELNNTFYKFPTSKTLRTWYNKTPDGFLFSVKAPKLITHIKRFNECEREINDFYNACSEGMAEKLACILFQFPPSFHFTQERLELIVGNLNFNFKNVVEFRHESWWIPEVWEIFEKNNIVFCSVSYPKLPTTIIEIGSTCYIRLHGISRLFYSEYADEELQAIIETISLSRTFKEVFIYFNNTASTAAISNALSINHFASKQL